MAASRTQMNPCKVMREDISQKSLADTGVELLGNSLDTKKEINKRIRRFRAAELASYG